MSTQVISTMSRPMTTPILVFSWACRIVAAIILLQTLFFKFTAAPESVYIFTKLGDIHPHATFRLRRSALVEVSGRIGSGIMELIAAVLLLTPRFVWAGAVLGDGGYGRSYRQPPDLPGHRGTGGQGTPVLPRHRRVCDERHCSVLAPHANSGIGEKVLTCSLGH